MVYTPTTWVNQSAPYLNADNLNKIEQGIADAHTLAGGGGAGGEAIPAGYTAPADTVDRTGTTNVQAELQAILNGGGKLYLSGGIFRCTSALLLDSNCHIYVAAGAKLLMDFATSGATSSSQIRTRNLTGGTGYYNAIQPSHDVWIYGPGEISQGTGVAGGNLFCIAGDRFVMKDIRTTYWNGGRVLIGVGDDWRIINCYLTGGQLTGSGNGGIRYMGGKRFMCIGTHVDSGDDSFQFVPAGSFTDPLFDVSIEDGAYIGCTGSSSSARIGVIVQQDQNHTGSKTDATATVGMAGYIRRSGFIGITGDCGGAAFVIQNASSSGPIEDCFVTNVMINGANNANTGQPGALYVNGFAPTGGIKRIFIDNMIITGHHRKGIKVDRGGEDIVITNSYFTRGSGQLSAAVAEITGNVKINNCVFDGLSTGTGDVIDIITSDTHVPSRVEIVNCRIKNVPNARFGVDVVNGTGNKVVGNHITELSGATTAQGYRVQATATTTRAHSNDIVVTSATKFTDSGSGTLRGTAAITD